VAQNRGHPDLQIIEQLEAHIGQLEARLVEIEEEVERASGSGQYTLKHMFYVLKRKLYELRLSVLLNKRKLAASNRLADERLHAPDPEVAQLGLKLNELRIKRRIYDYVIAALPDR
jgi:hypothetical protein